MSWFISNSGPWRFKNYLTWVVINSFKKMMRAIKYFEKLKYLGMFRSLNGGYHQEQSSQLITLNSQIFPIKNANLQSSGLVAKSSVFKTRQFWNLLSSHLRFWVSFNLLSSQRRVFRLPKNPVTPPLNQIDVKKIYRSLTKLHGHFQSFIRWCTSPM